MSVAVLHVANPLAYRSGADVEVISVWEPVSLHALVYAEKFGLPLAHLD